MTTINRQSEPNRNFLEKFALSLNRDEIIQSNLIHSTEYWYYFSVLNLLNKEEIQKDDELIKKLLDSYKLLKEHDFNKREELETRYKFLSYDYGSNEDKAKTFKWIIDKLKVTYSAASDLPSNQVTSASKYPSVLDESLLDPFVSLLQLSDYTTLAYPLLIKQKLSDTVRIKLLEQLTRADYEGLMDLILVDFEPSSKIPFGHYSIHNLLTLEQLDQLRKFKPDIAENDTFVKQYISRLDPPENVDIETDKKARRDYINTLLKLISELGIPSKSIKTTVLFWELHLNAEFGIYNLEKFMEYISIPKSSQLINENWRVNVKEDMADLNQTVGLLSGPNQDSELITNYLQHFFRDEKRNDTKPFNEYLDEKFLSNLLATTKLLYSDQKENEKWYNILGEDHVENLKNKVILKFSSENKSHFGIEDEVALKVELKNIPTLIIKVFEINTFSYYKKNLSNINSDIDLDGLIANHEEVHTYNDVLPLRLLDSQFKFPHLDKIPRGVFIIEFIGGGKRVRTCIRKGQLKLIHQLNVNGQSLYVLDEKDQILKDTKLHIGGHTFFPNKETGEILVPFCQSSTTQKVLITCNEFTTLSEFPHLSEEYEFIVGFYVDRESLLKFEPARVLVRAQLRVNGIQTSLSNLKDVIFEVSAIDKDKVPTQTRIPDFKLYEDKESEHVFLVPENIREFKFTLSAKIAVANRDDITVSKSQNFELNKIDEDSDITEDLHLGLSEDGYRIYALGKSGEPKANCVVQLNFKNKYRNPERKATLQSDEKGIIFLGKLSNIDYVSTPGVAGKLSKKKWDLSKNYNSVPKTINAHAKTDVVIPYLDTLSKDVIRLLQYNKNGKPLHDCYGNIHTSANGYLVLKGLEPGNYNLSLLENNSNIDINIISGIKVGKNVSNSCKIYHINTDKVPVQISSTTISKDTLTIQLSNQSPKTRVHVISSRFLPQYDISKYLRISRIQVPNPCNLPSSYHKVYYSKENNLSSEHSYILNRKYAKKNHGNTLEKPTLLLHPREAIQVNKKMRDKEINASYDMCDDEKIREKRKNAPMKSRLYNAYNMELEKKSVVIKSYTPNLDFLSVPSSTHYNLVPSVEGTVSIPIKSIIGSHIRIIAIDGNDLAFRNITLPHASFEVKDLRLDKQTLDGKKHFTEQRQITVVSPKQKFIINDLSTAKMEAYGTLSEVFSLLKNASGNKELEEFSWILNWEEMSEENKLHKYSLFSSHEINFFLFHKDKAFFDKYIYPFLRNKKDKDFMDYWLLGDDIKLQNFTSLYQFDSLNCVEKILLGIRLKNVAEGIRMWIKGHTEALPDNQEEFNHLFHLALKGKGLETGASIPPTFEPTNDELKRQTFYRPLGGTQQWADTGYWKLQKEDQNQYLIRVNKFWNDFSQHVFGDNRGSPFASKHFLYARSNISEIMFALSILDMPFKRVKHAPTYVGGKMEFVADTPTVYFHKEIRETQTSHGTILVSQNYFDPADPKTHNESGEEVDKHITEEFLVYKPYACQILMTNVSQVKQKLEILCQIPRGAIPLHNGFFTSGSFLEIEPNRTVQWYYYFYFPQSGAFDHYPVQIAKNEKVIAHTSPTVLNVVTKLQKIDTKSWEYLSQEAPTSELISYLSTENFISKKNDLNRIAWRLNDREVFTKIIKLLREKQYYHHSLWSYGLLHNDVPTTHEYLQRNPYFKTFLKPIFTSNLISINAEEFFEYLEYHPLVNERVHSLKENELNIQNPQFSEQYNSFIKLLCYKSSLSVNDHITVAYYLLLQDRVNDAKEILGRIQENYSKDTSDEMKLQYDYLIAYLDFFEPFPSKAEEIAKKYVDFPIESWRKRFGAILQQLDEIQGKSFQVTDEKDRSQQLTEMAEKEPSFEFSIEGKKITVDYRNISEILVSFFQMDVELLFSINPFSLSHLDQFSYVKPNKTLSIKFEENNGKNVFEIPKELHNGNMVISIEAAGHQKSQAYYSHSLSVHIFENSGQLKVTEKETKKLLSKVYVKVYASRKHGESVFYKDGYTDLRGRFDYATKNDVKYSDINKYSILILSDTHGTMTKEISPPKV